jgi:ATP-dependent Lhr-like helicase
MLKIYIAGDVPVYFNATAKILFNEGIQAFCELNLKETTILEKYGFLNLLPWAGDTTVHSLSVILRQNGITADVYNGIIEIRKITKLEFLKAAKTILSGRKPSPLDLVDSVPDSIIEKYDNFVPLKLRALDYAAKMFDVEKAWKCLAELCERA